MFLFKKKKEIKNQTKGEILADKITELMLTKPEKWKIDKYHAKFGNLKIWIANKPYGDFTINDLHLPKKEQLRNALVKCVWIQSLNKLDTCKYCQSKGKKK